MIILFAKGFALGLAIAAPVGPIGLLCIRRTLVDGPALGFATGIGAATADAAYGAVAGFGLAVVADAMTAAQGWMAAVGGLFLLWLGWKTAMAPPALRPAGEGAARPAGLVLAWATTFLLTVTNPATILSFAAAFAGLGLAEWAGDGVAAMVLVLGVFLGSAAWWLGLSLTVGRLRDRVTPAGLAWINRIGGGVLVAFGLAALYAAV